MEKISDEIIEKVNEIGSIFRCLPDEVCGEIIGFFFSKPWQRRGRQQTYISQNPRKTPPHYTSSVPYFYPHEHEGELTADELTECCGFRPKSYDIAYRAELVAKWYSDIQKKEATKSEKEDV